MFDIVFDDATDGIYASMKYWIIKTNPQKAEDFSLLWRTDSSSENISKMQLDVDIRAHPKISTYD